MKSFDLFFISILLIFSCKKDCQESTLISHELAWIPYSNGQILLFESDSINRDTLVVERRSSFVQPPRGEFCNDKVQTVSSYIDFGYDYIRIGITHKFNPELYTRTKRAELYYIPDTHSITINNITYAGLRLAFPLADTLGRITNIYYSKEKGIISYQVNSNVWNIVE
jgi:hypothetical protein